MFWPKHPWVGALAVGEFPVKELKISLLIWCSREPPDTSKETMAFSCESAPFCFLWYYDCGLLPTRPPLGSADGTGVKEPQSPVFSVRLRRFCWTSPPCVAVRLWYFSEFLTSWIWPFLQFSHSFYRGVEFCSSLMGFLPCPAPSNNVEKFISAYLRLL